MVFLVDNPYRILLSLVKQRLIDLRFALEHCHQQISTGLAGAWQGPIAHRTHVVEVNDYHRALTECDQFLAEISHRWAAEPPMIASTDHRVTRWRPVLAGHAG